MYRSHNARSGLVQTRYPCGSRLWRGRIKIVPVGARAGLMIRRLMRFLSGFSVGNTVLICE